MGHKKKGHETTSSAVLFPHTRKKHKGVYLWFVDWFSPLRIQRMTTVLNEKEDSLRKLKETLRRSQQQGEESCKSLHLFVLLSYLSLCLYSLVSTQQAEISKWKSRAIKLKGKGKPEVDKLLVTPKKLLESPKKLLDSPKASLLNSPKSRFFDMDGSSEILSRNCPKQFFDNSSLGTIPVWCFADAAAGAARKEEWWPQSPNQEEMCKTQ
uniref:Uncharacterized protein n=1 Tax=Seriola dumerili TaxID=41447 RepID=A0A3B4T7C3_SERDU